MPDWVGLLPAPSSSFGGSITAQRSRQDASPGIHILSPGTTAMRCFLASRTLCSGVCRERGTARLLTGVRRLGHISPVLIRRLRWLPVKQRVIYKLVTVVDKSLHGQAPSCLLDDCQCARRQLRFGGQRPRCPANIHSTRREEFPGCGLRDREYRTCSLSASL